MCKIGVQVYENREKLIASVNMRIPTSADLGLYRASSNSHVMAVALTRLGEVNVLKLFPNCKFRNRKGILESGKTVPVCSIPLGGRYTTVENLADALKLA
jgi:hypothetical protein